MNPRKSDSHLDEEAKGLGNEVDSGSEIEGSAAATARQQMSEALDDAAEPGASEAAEGVELGEGGDSPSGAAIVETPEAAIQRLETELTAMQDRHLRIAAEYDNFRKRTARERSESWGRAQAEVVSSILDALDDFARVLDVKPSQATVEDVITGVELVERKLVRELEKAGLERVGEVGESFDPNHHEAIGSLPAESEDQDHTVGAVLQVGYRFSGVLLRPAKVQVRMWAGAVDQEV